jgi:hypothetical protein
MALGRWIYRDVGGRLSGIAPQLELHYTTTMQDPDIVAGISNFNVRVDTLTLTGGLNFEFFNASTLTIACAAPLRGAVDPSEKQFDAELQIFFNRLY